jgi:radical SAM superfamily enzyme YgiQ (UPF0313 family)
MREPGEVLLISCYELGHQPLGIAFPMGFLERAGFSPDALDISRTPLLPAKVLRARLAGISVPMHTALRLGIVVAERIRELNPGCHICFYGLYALLNADHLLERLADSVLGGECEESLVELALRIESGERSRGPGDPEEEKLRRRDLKRLPFAPPSRRLLEPLTSYAALELGREKRTAGYVEASRGCLHHCRHCPIPPVYEGRFFVVPEELVLSDIRGQVLSGASHISFGDPDFLNGPGHSLAVAREMHREFPRVTFDFTAKIEHLLEHRDLLPELAALGCLFIVSAVESLNDQVLRILDKGHTRSDVQESLKLARAAGITLRPSLVPFTPWSSLEDYGELLEFVEREDLIEAVDPVQLSVRLLLPPGSLLLSHPAMAPHLGRLERSCLSHSWSHPDPRMDRLQREVSAVVELSAHRGLDPCLSFREIARCYEAIAGREKREVSGMPLEGRPTRRVPRLTESWFC